MVETKTDGAFKPDLQHPKSARLGHYVVYGSHHMGPP